MTEELHQVVAARQRDLGAPRLDGEDAKTCRAGKPPGVDGFGEARRVEGGVKVLVCSWYDGSGKWWAKR
jgi:hypothetical protein